MSKYRLLYSEQAEADIKYFKKEAPQLCDKIKHLLEEIEEHPLTGTGKPERLKYNYSGYLSRRINIEHRLMYVIDEENKNVYIYSLCGHY